MTKVTQKWIYFSPEIPQDHPCQIAAQELETKQSSNLTEIFCCDITKQQLKIFYYQYKKSNARVTHQIKHGHKIHKKQPQIT